MKKIFIALTVFIISFNVYALKKAVDTLGLNTALIQQLTGATGAIDTQENLFKITIPRDDLKITLNGVRVTSAMGLSSWITFKKADDNVVVDGDLALSEDQVNPILITVLTNNFKVTSIRNHFLWESPRVMFMHIEGSGKEKQMATNIGTILTAMQTTSDGNGNFPIADIDPSTTNLTTHTIDSIIGKKGSLQEGIYKIAIGKPSKSDTFILGNNNGINSWMAFAGTDDEAVVYGDITLNEDDLPKVIKALNLAEINIMGLHQQTTDNQDQQHLIVINYWGVGSTTILAKGLRTALDLTKDKNKNNLIGLAKACPPLLWIQVRGWEAVNNSVCKVAD